MRRFTCYRPAPPESYYAQGAANPPGEPQFEGFSLSIVVPDEGVAERAFNALAEGGKVEMPLAQTFWAPKFGMLEDRFGVGWMISVQHKS